MTNLYFKLPIDYLNCIDENKMNQSFKFEG